MLTYDDWKRAVVHLEGQVDARSQEERDAIGARISQFVSSGREPSDEDLRDDGRNVWGRGTAVFLIRDGRRYLVTARHVLTDRGLAELLLRRLGEPSEEYLDRWIWPMIFQIPSISDLAAGRDVGKQTFLMNLSAGVMESSSYLYSSPSEDLAVISLDQHNPAFANELESRGFVPIGTDEVTTGPSKEGAEVYSVGYPDSVAVLGEVPLDPGQRAWASATLSSPVGSWGRVAMQHEALNYFWADISVYPGNSGGPIIEDGKLVGIVSAQATVEGSGVPFAKIMNAGLIDSLIKAQAAKDSRQY